VLLERLAICTLCGGEAILSLPDPDHGWAWCPLCKGNGLALDGDFPRNGGKTEYVLHQIARLCDVGYGMAPRSTRRDQGALEPDELADLRERFSQLFEDVPPLLPAARNVDASLITVGPSHRDLVRWMRRRPSRAIVRGFIELRKGCFLDAANAMVRAQELGLVQSKGTMLRASWLPYHRAIPLYVVRSEQSGELRK
jgi:hypothetical protein